MAYTKKFTRPYATYKDRPDKTTPVTASIKNMESDTFESIENYLADEKNQFVTSAEKQAWNNKAEQSAIPTKLSQLAGDSTHRTVTDEQITKWNKGGGSGGGSVNSVNGVEPDEYGSVDLTLDDIPDGEYNKSISQDDRDNWDNKSDFSGNYEDLYNQPYIPSSLSELDDDSYHRTVTDEQIERWDAGGGEGAVLSVNGYTGAVVLVASDVNALPDNTKIPSKLSDLESDATHRTVTDTDIAQITTNKNSITNINQTLSDQARFIGKELYFNQCSQMNYVPTARSGLTFEYNKNNNTCVIKGTSTSISNASGWFGLAYNNSNNIKFVIGHKYLYMLKTVSGSFENGRFQSYFGNTQSKEPNKPIIITNVIDTTNLGTIEWTNGVKFNDYEFYILCVDLTDMYGAGNEPTDADYLASLFTENYPTTLNMPISNYSMISNVNSNLSDNEFLGWSVPNDCPIQNYEDANGDFHQRVGRVDLGELKWTYGNVGDNKPTFFANITDRKFGSQLPANAIASKYFDVYPLQATTSGIGNNYKDKTIYFQSTVSNIRVVSEKDTDVDAFLETVSGIYLYYELAEEVVIKAGHEAVTQLKAELANTTKQVIKGGKNSVFTLSNNFRGKLTILASSGNQCGEYFLYSTSNGIVYTKPIVAVEYTPFEIIKTENNKLSFNTDVSQYFVVTQYVGTCE